MENCDEKDGCKVGMDMLNGNGSPMPTNLYVGLQIMQKLKTLGSESDLSKFRQLDQNYYETLNPTFLDSMDKSISYFWSENVKDRPGKSISRCPFYTTHCGRAPTIQAFVESAGKNKQITPKNWTEKVSHIFRKLECTYVTIGQLRKSTQFMNGILIQTTPYITTLTLNAVPLQKEDHSHGQKFAEFLNEFTSLKKLQIYVYSHRTGEEPMSLDQLEIGFANLQLKPQIKLYANENHKEILAKFANKDHVSFELKFAIRSSLSFQDDLEKFENIVKNFGTLTNVEYNISTYGQTFGSLSQLEAFTRIVVQLDGQIKKLKFTFLQERTKLKISDQFGIRNCLAQMSPYVTKMTIDQRIKPAWEILPLESKWTKMTYLWIRGYQQPLEILKHCSSLKELALRVNQDSCFFSNHQKSEQENLAEYFGNLNQLVELLFPHDKRDGDKIVKGNELHEDLKSMLPQLRRIKYGQHYWKN